MVQLISSNQVIILKELVDGKDTKVPSATRVKYHQCVVIVMAISKVAGMSIVPSGYAVREAGGKTFLQKRRRSRKRYKLSKKHRQAIARSAKKMKIPILGIAAVGMPALSAFKDTQKYTKMSDKLDAFGRSLLASFTGVSIWGDRSVHFQPSLALRGLVPLGIYAGLSKFGILKMGNKVLAKTKLPIRL